jgi:sister chromatid cohesion protein DCC1
MSGTSSLDEEKIRYYPRSALPLDAAARFGALFSIHTRWKAEDIEPFLSDIAMDSKERDKLLLKYGRALADSGTVWYTAKAKYNG